jgi:hypothetical protein
MINEMTNDPNRREKLRAMTVGTQLSVALNGDVQEPDFRADSKHIVLLSYRINITKIYNEF